MKFATVRPRVAVFALLALIALVALAGCGEQNGANFLNPSGPQALQEANLFWFILVVATVIFVAVTGALIYSVIRFRARPGSPAARQFSGNTPLELVWTIVPSIVLLGVLVLTINTLFVGWRSRSRKPSPSRPLATSGGGSSGIPTRRSSPPMRCTSRSVRSCTSS